MMVAKAITTQFHGPISSIFFLITAVANIVFLDYTRHFLPIHPYISSYFTFRYF